MTALGFLGLLFGLSAFSVAFVKATQTRVLVFVGAALLHIASTVAYYLYVQNHPADTSLYYFDKLGFYNNRGFHLGTEAVVYIVQYSKEVIGGTYLDYFMLFQAMGMWGIALLMRTVEEIYHELNFPQPRSSYLILLLPGLHFWTSAIGKDAPLFLGCSLVVWAVMRLRTRFVWFVVAILIMVLFRAQIAIVALMGLALATALNHGMHPLVRMSLLVIGAAGVAIVGSNLSTVTGVDISSADSVASYLDVQSDIASGKAGGTTVANASYLVRLFSLLFRPLFVDANNSYSLIASIENVILMYIIFTIFRQYRDSKMLVRQVFSLRFAILFALITVLLLALVFFNVGLGLRQKTMAMPALLTFFSAVIAVRRMHTSSAVPSPT